mmetsp:Transcript_15875/g.11491  ORF Transcript_15875/g.11491 Transcript_15875/m.11491 type:complete len:89 (-) Transcript_15875:559-825(-)
MYYIFNSFWLHPVRVFLTTKWLVKEEVKETIQMIKQWSLLMPEKFFQKLIDMYLKPRLRKEIEDNWQPRILEPSNLVQNWLLPWREVL